MMAGGHPHRVVGAPKHRPAVGVPSGLISTRRLAPSTCAMPTKAVFTFGAMDAGIVATCVLAAMLPPLFRRHRPERQEMAGGRDQISCSDGFAAGQAKRRTVEVEHVVVHPVRNNTPFHRARNDVARQDQRHPSFARRLHAYKPQWPPSHEGIYIIMI